MGMSIGIVGLPNAGKSTVFNALTRTHGAQTASYPFCTIDPNRAIVPVPDARLESMAALIEPESVTPATVTFVDIAGLVRGAHSGEGLGNRFLAHIRESDAILHVVRGFQDDNVAHVEGGIDPLRDVDIVESELLLADLETVTSRLDKLSRQARAEPALRKVTEGLTRLSNHLDGGDAARSFDAGANEALESQLKELRLLTAKPVIFCVNTDESGLAEESAPSAAVASLAASRGAASVVLCAKMEEELGDISPQERTDFLSAYGMSKSGLDQVVRTGYDALGLISFFTTVSNQLRAWTVVRGTRAAQAAGVIHSDFEQGFIRAHVVDVADYIAHGGEAGCRSAGVLHDEGRDYEVRDGDVIHFLFHA
jgi:GTP-binding protein YchF